MISTPVLAVEVTTMDSSKSTLEFMVITTEETFSATLEKQYLAQSCRPRITVNGNIKELTFSNSCRAELTKFILNNGYKADQHYRTFVK